MTGAAFLRAWDRAVRAHRAAAAAGGFVAAAVSMDADMRWFMVCDFANAQSPFGVAMGL